MGLIAVAPRTLQNKGDPQISQIFTDKVDLSVFSIYENLSNLWFIPYVNKFRRAAELCLCVDRILLAARKSELFVLRIRRLTPLFFIRV